MIYPFKHSNVNIGLQSHVLGIYKTKNKQKHKQWNFESVFTNYR